MSEHAEEAPRGLRRRVWLGSGLALLAASVLLVFAPPPARHLVAPPPGTPLLGRLFPDVPAGFVGARLLLLACGALLVATALGRAPASAGASASRARAGVPGVPGLRLALAIAVGQLACLLSLPFLGWNGETLFVLAGFAPGLVLSAAARRAAGPPGPRERAPLWGALLLVGIWIALRLPVAWHDPRAADTLDTWLNFGWLESTLAEGDSLLRTGPQPGVTNLHLILLGVPLLRGLGIEPSLAYVQVAQAVAVAATALGIAAVSRNVLGAGAAWVAVSAFLFSPFTLSLLHVGTVFALVCALLVWTIWLAVRLRTSGSPAALALLGTLAGIATTLPQLAPFALAAGVATLVHALRGPRLPWAAWAVPTASFLAFALPAIPGPGDLAAMREAYVETHGEWAGLEAVLLGQQSRFAPVPVERLWRAGHAQPWDAALGTLLAPFATPRTALRLWGDVYLEPISGALVAVGFTLCMLHFRRERPARVGLALLAVAMLPGVTSAYDRASLTRALGIPVVAALLAGAGFEVLRRRLAVPGFPAALLGCAAIALSGIAVFDLVTPRLLPASHLGVALRLLERDPPAGGALLLDDAPRARVDWLHVGRIARHVPREPLAWRPFEGAPSLLRTADGSEPAAELFLYSPALERERGVEETVCALWRGTALYRFSDRAGLSSVLAARPAGAGWRPGWPADRVESRSCAGAGG